MADWDFLRDKGGGTNLACVYDFLLSSFLSLTTVGMSLNICFRDNGGLYKRMINELIFYTVDRALRLELRRQIRFNVHP